jgi:5-methylcytosine-specific restriction endonuclease McrA
MTSAYRTCTVDGCEGKHRARGFCQKHYTRWQRYGIVNDRPITPMTHGMSAYNRHGCRCEICTAAKRTVQAQYRSRHPISAKAADAAYYVANVATIKRRNAAYVKANPQGIRDAENRRRQTDPMPHRLAQIRRRALKAGVDSRMVTPRDWVRLCNRFHNCCAYCGKSRPLTQDHVIPLFRGGRDAIGNIVPACTSCNASKGTKLLIEWRRWRAGRTPQSNQS